MHIFYNKHNIHNLGGLKWNPLWLNNFALPLLYVRNLHKTTNEELVIMHLVYGQIQDFSCSSFSLRFSFTRGHMNT